MQIVDIRPHRLAAIPLSILALGCATTHGASTLADVQPTPIPVAASSMPSIYGVQMRLAGSAVVRDGWLYVVVPTGSVRTYQGTTQAWDLMLRAGLATCTSSGSRRLVSESRAARIAPLVGLTPDSAVLDTTVRAFTDTLRLDLGVPRGTKLERAWLTFELAWPIESTLAMYTLSASGALTASSAGAMGSDSMDRTDRWGPTPLVKRLADVLCRR